MEIKPRAAITEQKFPKTPRLSKPATMRAPDPAPAAVHAGSFCRPDARPIPMANVNMNESVRPVMTAQKTFHLDAILGSQ